MKVLLYYDYLSEIGGVERVMATHARWLEQAEHDVTLVFNYVSKEAASYAFLKDRKIQELSTLNFGSEPVKVFASLFGFNRINKFNPDLIVCYSFPSLFVARNLKCKKAFYYLPMEFVYYPLKKRWLWANDAKRKVAFLGSLFLAPILKILDKIWIRNKLVIANSDFTRKEIKERYDIDSVVSYPPLNSIFRPTKEYHDVLRKFGISSKFVLTAGRIVPDKKTDWLIKVFSKLKDKSLDFVVAGGISEDYKKTLLELAKSLGVEKRVKLIGLVDQKELAKLYSACEVFMFASPEEAFGLVPIEAMACGAPVVAWNDNAGPNEYVIPGLNGYLAKPYDLDDFAKMVEKILDEEFKVKNARKIVRSVSKFSEKEQYTHFIKSIQSFSKN